MEEIWKDIKGYEGIYQVSNQGNIKRTGRRFLKPNSINGGYLKVNLSKNNVVKTFKVHQLVAIHFLNHTPCGMNLVVNHINLNKHDNNCKNLEITTSRENSNLKHIKSSSKYVGVSWHKRDKLWCAQIRINGKGKHLGGFINEIEAHYAYQNELKIINDGCIN